MNRRHGKDHGAPEGMRGDLDQQISFPEIEKTPKGAGHQGSQDEQKIPGEDMNSRINSGGDQIPGNISPPCHETFLQKPSPEDLLPRSGNEEEKQKDKDLIGPHTQGINPSDLGFRTGQKMRSKFISQKKDKVEKGCREKPDHEGAEMERNFWPLPE